MKQFLNKSYKNLYKAKRIKNFGKIWQEMVWDRSEKVKVRRIGKRNIRKKWNSKFEEKMEGKS
jgi:hypothetical protein